MSENGGPSMDLLRSEAMQLSQLIIPIDSAHLPRLYVILMMALFSIYTAFIYNEFFSRPFDLFSLSAYECRDPSCRDATSVGLIKVHDTYPFGVDPVWHGTRSELPFLNSLKMN